MVWGAPHLALEAFPFSLPEAWGEADVSVLHMCRLWGGSRFASGWRGSQREWVCGGHTNVDLFIEGKGQQL